MMKAVIFDWAGVISAEGYWAWLRKNVADIENRRDYFQHLSEQVDVGEISNEEFEATLAKQVGKPMESIWPEIKREMGINTELVGYIRELRNKYKIALLSNFTYPWLHELLHENNLYESFDARFISSEQKLIKPDPRAFQKVLDMLGVAAETAVFIDDRQMHVDAAKQMGLHGILFTDNKQLYRDLSALGINPKGGN